MRSYFALHLIRMVSISLEGVNSTVHVFLAALCWFAFRAMVPLNELVDHKIPVQRAIISLALCASCSIIVALPRFSITNYFFTVFALTLCLTVTAFYSIVTLDSTVKNGPYSQEIEAALFRISLCFVPVAVNCWVNCLYQAVQERLKEPDDYRKMKYR